MNVQAIEYLDGLADYTAYGREEVEATLTEAHTVKAEYDAVMAEAWSLVPFDIIWGPFLTDAQRPLHDYLIECWEPQVVSRFKSGADPYPVKTWRKEIAKAHRQMAQVRKLMAKLRTA